jgi:hypothetical protein
MGGLRMKTVSKKYVSTYRKQNVATIEKVLKELDFEKSCYKKNNTRVFYQQYNENKTVYLVIKDLTFEGYVEAIRRFMIYSVKSGVELNSLALKFHTSFSMFDKRPVEEQYDREKIITDLLRQEFYFY